MLKQAKSLKNNYWVVVPKVQDYRDHFTSDSFEKESFLAPGFGLAKKKRLKPDHRFIDYGCWYNKP